MGEYGLPSQCLGRRLAIPAAVLDRKPAEMRKAAGQRDVHDFHVAQTLKELASRALEADITKYGEGRFAEIDPKLPLQCPVRDARGGRQLSHSPVVPHI
jgi:hypothetical protein